MKLDHSYAVSVEWTGNRGSGTSSYRDYGRDHVIRTEGAPDIHGSADTAFRGDADRWNPEEMLLAALSQCHLMSYLYVAAQNGIVVEAYDDAATASLRANEDGSGALTEATLRPVVTISSGDPQLALALHDEAERLCFIAASVAFPVRHEPRIVLADDPL